ncbi:MAG TPA: ROK family protein [Bacteroidota bacterium]
MSDSAYTIGIDIGGTNTVVGAVGHDGRCVLRTSFPTTSEKTAEDFVARIALCIRDLCTQLPLQFSLLGIGVAAPAARHREGSVRNPANLPWGTVNLVAMLKGHFNLPIALTNDSNAAALGELYYGAGRGRSDFVAMTLGTGLGSGIIVDGKLLYGSNDLAGELGHVILEEDGRECGCHRRGCAETYVSASGLRRTAFELLAQENEESVMRDISFSNLTARKIFDFAIGGDLLAAKAFQITGKYLGRLLVNAVTAYDPEAIILSGGLMESGDLLLNPTREYFNENLLSLYKGGVEIIKSGLPNNDAAILGASSLIGYTTQALQAGASGSSKPPGKRAVLAH